MTSKAVITGIGVVLPETQTLDALWQLQQSGASLATKRSDRMLASVVDESMIDEPVEPRLAKKLDAFTRFAMVASASALKDAALDIDSVDKTRCGVFVGNAFGGWRFTENELRNLHTDGPRAVSPFQATSWFPAAPQGQISIGYGIKGFSKTYMADRASSLHSVAAAARQVEAGLLDFAIAGGCESTNTDFVRTALEHFATEDGAGVYAPLSSAHSAFAVSEGAVFLIIESAERAKARGVTPYAQIDGFAVANAPCAPDRYSTDANVRMRAMLDALNGQRADLVLPDACGIAEADRAEAAALREVCRSAAIAVPKAVYGHSFGAEGALDIAYACLALRKQQFPSSPAITPVPPLEGRQFHPGIEALPVRNILINACATGGSASSLLLSK